MYYILFESYFVNNELHLLSYDVKDNDSNVH